MNIDAAYPRVAKIVADVLAVDEEEVAMKKRLIADLNAESIDFLDLIFQLEREFKVKIPRGQIEQEARGTLSEEEFQQNGLITPTGLEVLKNYLSEVPEEFFKDKFKVNDIPTLFTVETFCKLVVKAELRQPSPETVA